MSYDLHRFPPQPGVDPLVTAESEWNGEFPALHNPKKEARNRAVVAALLRVNPALHVWEDDPESIAEMNGITVQEAQSHFRSTEIHTPDGGNAIEIGLYADEAGILVPYWYTAETAESVFREVWEYVQVIERETGFKTYDPQTGRIVNSWADMQLAFSSYADFVPKVRELER
jgi:hypothetical protein